MTLWADEWFAYCWTTMINDFPCAVLWSKFWRMPTAISTCAVTNLVSLLNGQNSKILCNLGWCLRSSTLSLRKVLFNTTHVLWSGCVQRYRGLVVFTGNDYKSARCCNCLTKTLLWWLVCILCREVLPEVPHILLYVVEQYSAVSTMPTEFKSPHYTSMSSLDHSLFRPRILSRCYMCARANAF